MALIDKLTALGDAIRSKTGKTEKLTLDQMVVEINSLRQTPMYTVRFLNGDVVLQTSQVREGETPIFVGENPTPEPDFAFVGWLPEIAPVTGDVDYVAQFKYTMSITRAIIGRTIKAYNNDTIETVRPNAFYYCTNLQTVSLPSVTSVLKTYAFANCTNLSSVSLPSVVAIGSKSFKNSRLLSSVDIPNVQTIEGDVFSTTSASFYLPATPPTIQSMTFNAWQPTYVFHIPAGSLSAYQNATNWAELTEKHTFTEDA